MTKDALFTVPQVHPLTSFLRNHKTHIARLKETGTPEMLTVNGKAALVLLGVAAYQELLRRVERLEAVAVLEGPVSAPGDAGNSAF